MLTHLFRNAYIQIKQMLLRTDACAPLSILHYTYGLKYICIYVHLTCIFWSPNLLHVVVDTGYSENKDPQKLRPFKRPMTQNRRSLHDLETQSLRHAFKENQ